MRNLLHFALLLQAISIIACLPYNSSSDLPCESGRLVEVSAKPADWRDDVLDATTVSLTEGGSISFSTIGRWDVGLGSIDTNGKFDWCECPVREPHGEGYKGHVGALIGRIGENGTPFLIGADRTIVVKESGNLFLGSNDNLGPCDKVSEGSCYEDNRGRIRVCIEID